MNPLQSSVINPLEQLSSSTAAADDSSTIDLDHKLDYMQHTDTSRSSGRETDAVLLPPLLPQLLPTTLIAPTDDKRQTTPKRIMNPAPSHVDQKEELYKILGKVLVVPAVDGNFKGKPVMTLSDGEQPTLWSVIEKHVRQEYLIGAEKFWKVIVLVYGWEHRRATLWCSGRMSALTGTWVS